VLDSASRFCRACLLRAIFAAALLAARASS